MGDAVFEVYVRARLMAKDVPLERLHAAKVQRVRASAQAEALRRLMPSLSAEEQDLVRRARNLKTHVPRSATVADYRHSTAFEALLGMLYLQGAFERLEEVLATTDPPEEVPDAREA